MSKTRNKTDLFINFNVPLDVSRWGCSTGIGCVLYLKMVVLLYFASYFLQDDDDISIDNESFHGENYYSQDSFDEQNQESNDDVYYEESDRQEEQDGSYMANEEGINNQDNHNLSLENDVVFEDDSVQGFFNHKGLPFVN